MEDICKSAAILFVLLPPVSAQNTVGVWALAAVGGLIALVIICAAIFVCILFCKRREEQLRVVHVRAAEDWVCDHQPIILEHKRAGSGRNYRSTTYGMQTEKSGDRWDRDSDYASGREGSIDKGGQGSQGGRTSRKVQPGGRSGGSTRRD